MISTVIESPPQSGFRGSLVTQQVKMVSFGMSGDCEELQIMNMDEEIEGKMRAIVCVVVLMCG